ncbi:MAG: hypothetical protein ACOX0E_10145 [Syntrophomonadaceae bacterium]
MNYTDFDKEKKMMIGNLNRDSQESLWRYMDIISFIDILQTHCLHFCRADNLGDVFEGTRTELGQEIVNRIYQAAKATDDLEYSLDLLYRNNRQYQFVSCWHRSEYESDAMWKLYANRGLAVKTTVKALIDSIKPSLHNIYFGNVKYVDNKKDMGSIEPNASILFYKQICFEHEQEFRAITARAGRNKQGEHVPLNALSILIPIDIDLLIEEVYISPLAPQWYKKVVDNLMEKYELHRVSNLSPLVADPG